MHNKRTRLSVNTDLSMRMNVCSEDACQELSQETYCIKDEENLSYSTEEKAENDTILHFFIFMMAPTNLGKTDQGGREHREENLRDSYRSLKANVCSLYRMLVLRVAANAAGARADDSSEAHRQ
eukprot:TRINITY_DN29739_c0_g1_i1.p1 TRINITY_DN29739_c0_g1~~TRINITY_DN29739_c0_g1_i1.p1  ORF type:complete len:124 (-),score=14.05 TRINITY_DN29739_c0_g1_i1:203-574(-)